MDHQEGARRVKGGAPAGLQHGALRSQEGCWLPLEDGIEVYFAAEGTYRTGDYWLIPARTATGAAEWPVNAARKPLLQAPLGVQAHYAPLAWVLGERTEPDLRQSFGPLAAPVPAANDEVLAAEAATATETGSTRGGGSGRGGGGGSTAVALG
ncbi:DUF6519 domain-containing protein [Streptomyces sp. NPDC051776]|uniref:DUF6519 domain-containing protein n=1 Tax=Streptomyces sp. NPDC051776 TaxID=3155414 RepID=UPI00343C9D6B